MKVHVATHIRELTKIIHKLKTLLSAANPPGLLLNRHCPECEYRERCRAKGAERDDLSLLSGLTEKEQARLNQKGIFTVNQLSHTFRPRRRAKRLITKPEKYHHSLRALAIREKKNTRGWTVTGPIARNARFLRCGISSGPQFLLFDRRPHRGSGTFHNPQFLGELFFGRTHNLE